LSRASYQLHHLGVAVDVVVEGPRLVSVANNLETIQYIPLIKSSEVGSEVERSLGCETASALSLSLVTLSCEKVVCDTTTLTLTGSFLSSSLAAPRQTP
jgi:hypothetical protein